MKKIILFILIITLGVSIYAYIWYENLKNIKINVENFKVEKWDNAYKIKEKLCKKHIIKNCLAMDIYLYLNKKNDIKKWTYNFSWVSIDSFFEQLKKWPKQNYKKFTILPSWTKFDIVEKINPLARKNFLNLINDENFIKKLKQKYSSLNSFWDFKSLEWFIYPDTYFFKKDDLNSYLFPELLIKTAVKNFDKKWKSINFNKKNANPYKLSNYEILIFASIVEKEEKNPQNKPMIADILIRRYKAKWFIGADWTLCYGLKIKSKDCKNYLNWKYLKDRKNPYNTRAVLWLPPTPVGNPTIESIEAVIYPKKNKYWYYLHWKDGKIHYGKNANEHKLNKIRYLK